MSAPENYYSPYAYILDNSQYLHHDQAFFDTENMNNPSIVNGNKLRELFSTYRDTGSDKPGIRRKIKEILIRGEGVHVVAIQMCIFNAIEDINQGYVSSGSSLLNLVFQYSQTPPGVDAFEALLVLAKKHTLKKLLLETSKFVARFNDKMLTEVFNNLVESKGLNEMQSQIYRKNPDLAKKMQNALELKDDALAIYIAATGDGCDLDGSEHVVRELFKEKFEATLSKE